MNTFFAVYGGCRTSILKSCRASLIEMRARMGMLLFAVVCVSSLMAGMAWYSVTNRVVIGVAVGVLWFVLFSVLDNVLMASLDGVNDFSKKPGESNKQYARRIFGAVSKKLVFYAVRIAIIGVVAHFNAKAVNLVIYQPEID